MFKFILISGTVCFLGLFLFFVCDKDDLAISKTESKSLDWSLYELNLVYEADFSKPLKMVHEDYLFNGSKRVSTPGDVDWVLEGPGTAWTENNKLFVSNASRDNKNMGSGHVVLWNTRTFPENFILEFNFSPKDSNNGLAIIFFCATGRDGGDIFDLKQVRRDGNFIKYHTGELNCYHVSYWAMPRKTANLRKNYGKHLVASGTDNIGGQGPGPHKVRLLKAHGKIQLETRDRLALIWQDDDNIFGDGCIGLRTMKRTGEAIYSNFKVWEVVLKE